MRDTVIVINSFVHDMATTGVWVAMLCTMYIISGRSKEIIAAPQGAGFIGNVMDRLWVAAIISMIIVVITGIIRSISFKRYGWTGDVARGRVIKHLLLGVFAVFGLYLQFTLMVRV